MADFFNLLYKSRDCKARAGVINTDHGVIETPIFMPVGTQGTVKAIEQNELKKLGAQIILGNTYHLYLRPGTDVIHDFGGLHRFIKWDRPILTDSGGYQVFSLKDLRKFKKDGVEFRSYIDGSKHFFTAESVVEIQRLLGSDIIMVLDECTPYPCEYIQAKKSCDLSREWAERSRRAFLDGSQYYEHRQFQFGIAQGSMYKDLRANYLNSLLEIRFDGYSIGGLSVGEPAETMYEITDMSTSILPENQPRYLMGVGTPENILESIELGIDMFDCVMPTRNARNGQLFTTHGKINIRNAKYKFSKEPIDCELDNYLSNNYSLGYMRHLFNVEEILGLQIATQHNLAFYLWLVKTAREKILSGEFRQWKSKFLANYNSKDM